MKFAYEDLGDGQFEELIVLVCQRLLGISVQGFAAGADGGRDAKFVGTAALHPSTASPWQGITIVQAKHTNGLNKLFSEPDFYSSKGKDTVLAKEVVRLKSLRDKKQVDNYMLFSNRRLGGTAESEIRTYLSTECGIPEESIYLCGSQQLETWFKQPEFSHIPAAAKLDPIDSPLIVSPDDLSEIVQALAANKDAVLKVLDDPPTQRVTYAEKNKVNQMTDQYAKAQVKRYLKQTRQIQSFLAAPENSSDILPMYESVADEFQLKIIAKRKNYQSFDEVMEYLADLLFNRDVILRGNKKLTRAMLFYMYWNCDIGEVADAATN